MKKLIYLGVLLLTLIGVAFAEPDVKTTECQELFVVKYVYNGRNVPESQTLVCTFFDEARKNICYVTVSGLSGRSISCLPLKEDK